MLQTDTHHLFEHATITMTAVIILFDCAGPYLPPYLSNCVHFSGITRIHEIHIYMSVINDYNIFVRTVRIRFRIKRSALEITGDK